VLTIMLCAAAPGLAQANPMPVGLWDHYVGLTGGPNTEIANAFVIARDGDLLVAGAIEIPGAGRDVLVARLTPDGDPEWVRSFGTAADDEALGIVEVAAGSIYLVGYTRGFDDGADLLISSFTGAGNHTWTRRWGEGQGEEDILSSVVEATDGSVWACGTTGSFLPRGHQKALLLQISASGRSCPYVRVGKLLSPFWEVSGTSLAEVFDADGNPDGFCVTGKVDDLTHQRILLARFGNQPQFYWADAIGAADMGQEGHRLIRTPDACLAIAGDVSYFDDIYMNYGGLVLKTDSDAQLAWARRVPGTAQYISIAVRGLTAWESGEIIASGRYRNPLGVLHRGS